MLASLTADGPQLNIFAQNLISEKLIFNTIAEKLPFADVTWQKKRKISNLKKRDGQGLVLIGINIITP